MVSKKGMPCQNEARRKIPLEFYEVRDLSSRDCSEAIQIYNHSFHPEVRRPASSLISLIQRRQTRMVVGRIDHKVALVAVLFPIPKTRFVLLDYLATDEAKRSMGLGGQFLEKAFDLLEGISFDHLLVEVEDPMAAKEEYDDCIKRIGFYRRSGAKMLKDLRYLLPSFNGGEPSEMKLMLISRTNIERLEGGELKEAITRVYSKLYGRDDDDEILNQIIKGMPEEVELID
jgi:hypothetical protein